MSDGLLYVNGAVDNWKHIRETDKYSSGVNQNEFS